MALEICARGELFMETGDSRKVGGAERGLEFKGSSRAL